MAGLPKKYAKMGFKKGWPAYRASKRKGNPKRKSTSKKRAPAKRKRRTLATRTRAILSRPTIRRTMNSTTKLAMNTAIGLTGAIGTAAVVNAIPGIAPGAKALSQMLAGAAMIILLPKRQRAFRLAGYGATLAGALAVTKTAATQAGIAFPTLAGYDQMAVPMPSLMGHSQVTPAKIAADPSASAYKAGMGLNKTYMGENFQTPPTGYGGEFLTAADF